MNGGASYMGTSQPTAAHGMMREGAPKPERVRWQPKPERRVLKLAAKMASAARRQFADRATRRVLVLDRTVIAEMATRTKKQQRRKAKALAKFMGRTKAGGATFVSQHVRL